MLGLFFLLKVVVVFNMLLTPMINAGARVSDEKEAAEMNKERVSDWKNMTVEVHSTCAAGTTRAHGKRGEYNSRIGSDAVAVFPVTAFVANGGQIWVGPEQGFYIETPSGVVGGKMFCGSILWCESLFPKRPNEKTDVDSIIARFEREVHGSTLQRAANAADEDLKVCLKRYTRLLLVLPELFDPHFNNQEKTIQAVRVTGKTLQFDLKSHNGRCTATVWIDIESKKLLKAFEDGKQVFPK